MLWHCYSHPFDIAHAPELLAGIATSDGMLVINTEFKTKEECPIQPNFSSNTEGYIEIFKKYASGLKDIETFSHIYIYIIYLFDRAGEIQLVRPTFLDDEPHGIYASRHPCRPNSKGMSIVRLIERNENKLNVMGIDVLNGTLGLRVVSMKREDIRS